ncbi:hypothetical protein BP5796_07712 [Coleophoma crateriformis]|uniref:Uncharacterized protein n=1 Tax=Coleophoma crateriformis TaxID=565419 RepID=A0A3D8RCN3_9HELO|nr:hypothetical protein BP5796_07712 [Coleophoma crateriformis]
MSTEKSQALFLPAGHVPIEDAENSNAYNTTAAKPTTNEKSMPLATTEPEQSTAPPAYTEDAGPSISNNPVASSSSHPTHRRKPIAIPAIGASFDAPFIRAYPPMLMDYKLPKEVFFSFLDNLNEVVASSPPLQVLDAAGGILRPVPILFPLHFLGAAVSSLANLGSLGVSKGGTERAIRQANKEVFGPRGLKVEIAKLDALAFMAGIPILDSKGQVSRQSSLLQPIVTESSGEKSSLDTIQRQLKLLEPWVAEAEIEPLPWTSKSKLTRFNESLKKRGGHGRPDEHQRRLAKVSADYHRQLDELDREEQNTTSLNTNSEKLSRILADIAENKTRIQARYESDVKRINDEFGIQDFDGGLRKHLWLTIRDVGANSGIVD